MINLKNLNIILTGSTGVIGNSILDKLISAGANVLATGTNEQKLNKIRENFLIRNKLAYFNSDLQSLYSCCVTTNIIDLDKYHIELDSSILYVTNLPKCVKRKKKFINTHNNIKKEINGGLIYYDQIVDNTN